jgi:hypothetical protein
MIKIKTHKKSLVIVSSDKNLSARGVVGLDSFNAMSPILTR